MESGRKTTPLGAPRFTGPAVAVASTLRLVLSLYS